MKRLAFLAILCLSILTPTGVAQDECVTAVVVVAGVNGPFDNTLMSDSPEPAASQWPVGVHKDMWFTYTHASAFSQTRFDTCAAGTNTDTMIAIYDGSGGCGGLVELSSNDDFSCGPTVATGVFKSGAYAPTTLGTTYYVRVSSWGGPPVGTFSINISSGDPPANDECLGAIAVADGINPLPPLGASGTTYTHEYATSSAPGWPCGGNANDGDVWFVFVGSTTGSIAVETCNPAGFAAGTSYDTVVEVFDGTAGCGALVSVGCSDDTGCGPKSRVTFAAVGGTTYFARVGRYVDVPPNAPQGGHRGTFYLKIGNAVPPPANDNCSTALALVNGSNGPFDNTYATDSGTVPSCAIPTPNFGGVNADLWFSYTATCAGPLTFDTGCGATSHDTMLAVYDGSGGCVGAELGCDDDGCGIVGGPSKITLTTTPGASYLVQAGSWSPWGGVGTFPIVVTEGGNLLLVGSNPPFPPNLSVQINWSGGPPLGKAALFVTLNAGAYPNGWFLGIEPSLAEVGAFANDPAFNNFPLNACGQFQLGPFVLPPAFPLAFIPFYMVSVATPVGGGYPIFASNPATVTIQ